MKKKKIMNYLLLFMPLVLLMIISLLNMYKASISMNTYKNYMFKQALWFALGFLIIFIITKVKPKVLFKYSKYLYIVNIILLILVLFFGKSVNGSKAWFNLKFFSFQPSELMKLSLTLYLSEAISKLPKENFKNEFIVILKALFLTLIPALLVFLEPDTGAIIIYLLIMLGVIIAYKINYKWFLFLGLFLGIILGSFFILYSFNKDLLIKIIGTSFFYRVDRLLTFINNDSFQLNRALITIGNAKLFKAGASVYIPEAPTDFIIAYTIGNFGIISFILVIISFFFINFYFLQQFFLMKHVKNKLFISGFLFMFLFAQIQNIGMNLGLFPIIGLPLPFLSYGGTNIMVYFMFLGILINLKN